MMANVLITLSEKHEPLDRFFNNVIQLVLPNRSDIIAALISGFLVSEYIEECPVTTVTRESIRTFTTHFMKTFHKTLLPEEREEITDAVVEMTVQGIVDARSSSSP